MIKLSILTILLLLITGCTEKHKNCPTQKCINGVQIFDTCRDYYVLIDEHNNALLCKNKELK